MASRLTKDLKDLTLEQQHEPIYNISAHPLDGDLFSWHANLVGPVGTPYEGGIFHMEISFPEDYPMHAPSVKIFTSMPHPHVIDDRICLDLLQDYESYFDGESDDLGRTQGTGWSSAYSVYTLLIQMQTFLVHFDDCSHLSNTELSMILRKIPKAIQEAKNFSCTQCGHKPSDPWPPFITYPQEPNEESSEEYSDDYENNKDSDSNSLEITKNNEKKPMQEILRCYHTKKDFTEAVLGVGITKEVSSNNYIVSLNSCFDIVSFDAYREGVRHDASNMKFTNWIPLYINEDHGKRALPYIKKAMSEIATNSVQSFFDPKWIPLLLPKLMSSMTVNLMSKEVHTSLRALTTYCAFHRMFLLFAEKYPPVVAFADQTIKNFVTQEDFRMKKVVKSLGEFLPLLTISKYSWDEIAEAYLTESLDRNVRWYLQKIPALRRNKGLSIKKRNNLIFESSKIGLKVLVFHVKFLDLIACPSGKSLKEIAQDYDDRWGMPSEQQKQDLLKLSAEAGELSSWDEFFEAIRLPVPRPEELSKRLQQARLNSKRKQYHSDKVCHKYKQGHCSYGDHCRYFHPKKNK